MARGFMACSRKKDTSVVCHPQTVYTAGHVRLTGGATAAEWWYRPRCHACSLPRAPGSVTESQPEAAPSPLWRSHEAPLQPLLQLLPRRAARDCICSAVCALCVPAALQPLVGVGPPAAMNAATSAFSWPASKGLPVAGSVTRRRWAAGTQAQR
jgi:hypothetical protein